MNLLRPIIKRYLTLADKLIIISYEVLWVCSRMIRIEIIIFIASIYYNKKTNFKNITFHLWYYKPCTGRMFRIKSKAADLFAKYYSISIIIILVIAHMAVLQKKWSMKICFNWRSVQPNGILSTYKKSNMKEYYLIIF